MNQADMKELLKNVESVGYEYHMKFHCELDEARPDRIKIQMWDYDVYGEDRPDVEDVDLAWNGNIMYLGAIGGYPIVQLEFVDVIDQCVLGRQAVEASPEAVFALMYC